VIKYIFSGFPGKVMPFDKAYLGRFYLFIKFCKNAIFFFIIKRNQQNGGGVKKNFVLLKRF